MILAIGMIAMGFICFSIFHSIVLFCFFCFYTWNRLWYTFSGITNHLCQHDYGRQAVRRANSTYLLGFDLGISMGMLLGAI